MTLTAVQLYRRGVASSNARRHATARRELETALARTDDAELRARIVGTLANLISLRGEPERARALCQAALDVGGISPHTAAVLQGQLGLLALGRGDFEATVSYCSLALEGLAPEGLALEGLVPEGRALEGLGQTRDDDASGLGDERANVLLNRSIALMQLGRLDASLADLGEATQIYARVGDAASIAMCEHNAGYLALLQGDLVRALEGMQRAAEVLSGDSSVTAAIGELDRAEVLRDAGLTSEAEFMLARAARTFGAHGMRQARGEAEFNLARSLLLHDPARAVAVARAAARRFAALGSEVWAARSEGVRLRGMLVDAERAGAAVADAEVEAAAARLIAAGFEAEALTLRLAHSQARVRAGHDDARTPRVPPGAPLGVRMLGHEVRAQRAAMRGHGARARRAAGAGLDELAAWQQSFGSLDLLTSVAMHGRGLMLTGLSSALRSRRADVVFEWSERARHLSQQVVPLRPPPDPVLAEELAELRMLRADSPGDDWLSSRRATELSDRVRGRQWATTDTAGTRARVSLEDARAGLGDAALLAYVWDGMSLACLVVDARGTVLLDIADRMELDAVRAGLRADLEMSASVRTAPLGEAVRRSLAVRLERLSAMLLARALTHTSARRLVLTVPGVLGEIPWAMLPHMAGHPFTLARSTTRWLGDRGGGGASLASRRAGFVAGPRVARGEEEVGAAVAAWRAQSTAEVVSVLTGSEATTAGAGAVAASTDVLHIAAHGRHSAENPMFSGLELVDGTLFGYDIDLMSSVPHTVVLSSCELGRSSVRWGEEAIGMTRAWLHAGTSCVVAAPVVVADDVACELLGAMHTHLAAGLAPADALAAASEHTGFVTPFQCHGAGF